jgi:hypothetical protein
MRITSPEGKEVVEIFGRIVWNDKDQSYGVQFANAHKGTLAVIQNWLMSISAAGAVSKC